MKQRGSWPKNSSKLKENFCKAFFHLRKIGASLHQLLNLRKENFVVDSGASMHMISKKDLNSGEMDTLTKSCSPTIVITANGEVQTHEEAAVCQRIGYTLENESPPGCASSFIARKALRRTRILIRVDHRSKATSHLKRYSESVYHRELLSDRFSWFVNEFFLKFAFFNIHDTFKAGS